MTSAAERLTFLRKSTAADYGNRHLCQLPFAHQDYKSYLGNHLATAAKAHAKVWECDYNWILYHQISATLIDACF